MALRKKNGHWSDLEDKNELKDSKGKRRAPGADPRTGQYSTAQMLRDEMYGGDTGQPLFD